MTDADRQRLAAILGMLGSEHAGERAAAGLQAEAFRKGQGLTWPELLSIQPEEPPAPAEPEPPVWTPRPAGPAAPLWAGPVSWQDVKQVASVSWFFLAWGVIIGIGYLAR